MVGAGVVLAVGSLAGSSTGWLAGAGDYGGEFWIGAFSWGDW